jgi:hypothetical protein
MVRFRNILMLGMAGGFFVAGWLGGGVFSNSKAGGRGAGDVAPTGSAQTAAVVCGQGCTVDFGSNAGAATGAIAGRQNSESATVVAQADATAVLNPVEQAWADAVRTLTTRLQPGMLVELLAAQGDFATAFAVLDTHVPAAEYGQGFYLVFSHLATHDANAAAAVYGTINDPELKAAAMLALAMAWANQDVQKGFDFLKSQNESGDHVESAYSQLMQRYALYEPADAAEIVALLEPGRVQAALLPTVAMQFAREDPRAALAWIGDLGKNGVATADAVDEIFMAWASDEPFAALDHVLHSTGDLPGDATVGYMVEELARANPPQAAAMFDSLPDGVRAHAAQSLARHWVKVDPQGATQWINQLARRDERDLALSEVAQYSMDENAANAFQWAAAIENGQVRFELFRNAVWSWDLDDAASLRNAIATAPMAERERKSLLDTLNLRLTKDRPSSLILP